MHSRILSLLVLRVYFLTSLSLSQEERNRTRQWYIEAAEGLRERDTVGREEG